MAQNQSFEGKYVADVDSVNWYGSFLACPMGAHANSRSIRRYPTAGCCRDKHLSDQGSSSKHQNLMGYDRFRTAHYRTNLLVRRWTKNF